MARASNFMVVGDFTIDPKNRNALIEALLLNRRQTLATEVGCRTYEVCIREDGDANHVYMVEIYDDRAAFESHSKTAHFKIWNDTAAHLIKDTKATFLNRMFADPLGRLSQADVAAGPPTGRALDHNRRIIVLSTLDTKGEEARFVADCIRHEGLTPWIIDIGIAGVPALPGDTTREVIARAAGKALAEIAALPRSDALEVVAAAATPIVRGLVERGEAAGIIGIGGGTGTWLCNAILRGLPLGFPKLIVSTLPSHDAMVDIAVMPSVADIAGMNRILTPILANAAGAICGMARRPAPAAGEARPTVALTMFGVTTRGATHVRRFLEDAGCEVVVFHANGTGGRTMEMLADRAAFDVVLDWTLSEITDEIAGGVCTAGPQRLEAAGRVGTPQIVVPGAVDVINFLGAVPDEFAGRAYHMHLPGVPLVRASVEENRRIGEWVARKLNEARGPVHVLIPEGGYSALDVPGGPFEDHAANDAFTSALARSLDPRIRIDRHRGHINSESFARAAADAVIAMIPMSRSYSR